MKKLERQILFVLLLVLCFLRRPEAFLSPQLWAEDGVIFFQQNEAMGLGALFNPYGGYLHIFPRLFAWFASLLPLGWTAALYFYGAVALFLYSCLCFALLGRSWLERALIGSLPLLLPANGEIFFSPTNLQWVLPLGCLGLLHSSGPHNRWQRVYLTLSFFSGFTALFALVGTGFRKSFWSLLALVAIAIQLSIQVLGPFRMSVERVAWAEWPKVIELSLSRFFSTGIFGQADTGFLWVVMGLGFIGWTLWSVRATEQTRMYALLRVAGVAFLAAGWRMQESFHLISMIGNGGRYFFIPMSCLFACLVMGFGANRSWRRRVPAILLYGCFVVTSLRFWSVEEWTAPPWREQVVLYCSGDISAIIANPVVGAPGGRAEPNRTRCK